MAAIVAVSCFMVGIAFSRSSLALLPYYGGEGQRAKGKGRCLPLPPCPLPLLCTMSLIVFDLDGTLIDSRLDLAESTNEMLSEYGATPLPVDAVAAMVGEGAKVLVARALGAAGLDPDDPVL